MSQNVTVITGPAATAHFHKKQVASAMALQIAFNLGSSKGNIFQAAAQFGYITPQRRYTPTLRKIALQEMVDLIKKDEPDWIVLPSVRRALAL
jgi:hypothetical protein